MMPTFFHIAILPHPAAFCAVRCPCGAGTVPPAWAGKHGALCAILADRHKAHHIEVAIPAEQMQVYGCLCSMQHGHARPVGCPPWRLPPLQHPKQSAALSPKMPSAHVSHIPIVFSPLQVLHFPVRAMYSLAEANQYAPGPLSYKMPTYLKRGWGVQTFRSDPALLKSMAKLPLIFRGKELACALKYSEPRNNSNKQKI